VRGADSAGARGGRDRAQRQPDRLYALLDTQQRLLALIDLRPTQRRVATFDDVTSVVIGWSRTAAATLLEPGDRRKFTWSTWRQAAPA